MDTKEMVVTPTTSWPKSNALPRCPISCLGYTAMLAYGVGIGFAVRLHALVSDRHRALITGSGCIGMYIALFSRVCGAKASRWEFDEDRC